jgi:hypothetical protein
MFTSAHPLEDRLPLPFGQQDAVDDGAPERAVRRGTGDPRGPSGPHRTGELDIATEPELAAAVDAQLATGADALVIDLTHTVFMDSSGARQLTPS